MNELDLVTQLTPQAPLPAPAGLAGARGRLAAAIAAERAGTRAGESESGSHLTAPAAPSSTGRARPWRARPAKRLALVAAVAAAAAAAAALIVALPGHDATAPPVPGRPALGRPETVNVAAARFFRAAARVTRQLPAHPPGPHQFVYTQTEGAGGAHVGRLWLSAQGNQDGLIQDPGQRGLRLPPCTAAQAQVPQKSPPGTYPGTMKCAEDAGYLPSMPVNPHKLLAYLYRIGIAEPGDSNGTSWAANDFGKAVDFLMSTTYLLPAQQAALFELMAQFPGFTIVHGARDAIGRVGVGIKWTFNGSPTEIILNPVSYAYMGDRTWPVAGFHGPGAGAYQGAALVKMAFVNKAGQLP
jgi:hypothetical protein